MCTCLCIHIYICIHMCHGSWLTMLHKPCCRYVCIKRGCSCLSLYRQPVGGSGSQFTRRALCISPSCLHKDQNQNTKSACERLSGPNPKTLRRTQPILALLSGLRCLSLYEHPKPMDLRIWFPKPWKIIGINGMGFWKVLSCHGLSPNS